MRERESIYDYAGGGEAFLAVATALNERCLADPVVNHPFSHADQHPEHLERLAAYLAEVFGGPPRYSEWGGHSAMLAMHAGSGADDDLGDRFLDCFDHAVDDANFPNDPELRGVLHDFMAHATREFHDVSPVGTVVAKNLAMPRWSWGGKVDSGDE